MTKDEALQMCLEYIETNAHERKYVRHAIKEALAQPEQEPVAKYSDVISDGGLDPRNTTPPKREWVGLTEEDFQPMVHKAMAYYGYNPEHSTLISGAGFYALVRNIETKLKEKNS